jgi:vacuolar protein sorting-associated protein 13A/C
MSTSLTYINPLFQKEEYLKEHDIKIKDFYYEPGWMKEKIPELNEEDYQKIIFINELNASSLEFNLTFIAQTKDQMFEKILKLNDFLTGILNVLNKTENVPLLLHGGISYNLLGNISQIFNILFEIYKQQILIQFVKLFGGMEILGNPINFLNNIGKGFQDLLTKPGEGLMQGPIEVAKGLADGATSLVKHTVNGTFNSTSKITSGISQGILFLTQDDDYINERKQKKITEKPKDVMEGIGYGLSAMVGSVFSGISDVTLKPI